MPDSANAKDYYQQWYADKTPVHAEGNLILGRFVAQLKTTIQDLSQTHPAPRALEVGSGGGNLQDEIERYIGIDLAASAARFMHKPFCAASATQLPFVSHSFDLVWSIWTLEHVFEPEQMLSEMLRVTRPGGLIFLCAAWNVPDWASRGYHVRPWASLNHQEKWLRLTFRPRYWLQRPRLLASRLMAALTGQRAITFQRRLPNYEHYYDADADACVSIDSTVVVRWFISRGVRCLSHPTFSHRLLDRLDAPLIFQRPSA